MDTFTNHSPGPRGIALADGTTAWIAAGETIELDPALFARGPLPDLGQPDMAEAAAAAEAEIDRLRGQVAELQARNANLQALAVQPDEPEDDEDFEPLDWSIEDLKAYLATITDAEAVQTLIDAETGGEARDGVVSMLNDRLDELLDA